MLLAYARLTPKSIVTINGIEATVAAHVLAGSIVQAVDGSYHVPGQLAAQQSGFKEPGHALGRFKRHPRPQRP